MNLLKSFFLNWKQLKQKRRITTYSGDSSNYNNQDYYSQTDFETLYNYDVRDDLGSSDTPQFNGFEGGDGGGGGATCDSDSSSSD